MVEVEKLSGAELRSVDENLRLQAADLARVLTEAQQEALFAYPKGHFREQTLRALRKRGLINSVGRTDMGNLVVEALSRKAEASRGQ